MRFSGVEPPAPLFPAVPVFHERGSRPAWLTLLPSAAIHCCSARTLQQFCCSWHYPATFRNCTVCSNLAALQLYPAAFHSLIGCLQQSHCSAALSRLLLQPHWLAAAILLLPSPRNSTATCCYHVGRLPDVAVVRDRDVTLTH